jgi:hypothetical protein
VSPESKWGRYESFSPLHHAFTRPVSHPCTRETGPGMARLRPIRHCTGASQTRAPRTPARTCEPWPSLQASSPVWTEEKYKKGSRTTIYLIRSTVLDMFRLSSVVFSALVLSAIAVFAYDPTRSDNVSDSLSCCILRTIYVAPLFSWLSIGVCKFRCFCVPLFISPRPKLVWANPWQRRRQLATDNLELLPGARVL